MDSNNQVPAINEMNSSKRQMRNMQKEVYDHLLANSGIGISDRNIADAINASVPQVASACKGLAKKNLIDRSKEMDFDVLREVTKNYLKARPDQASE